MLKAGGGSIVNIASVEAHTILKEFPAYVASKHALIGLTRGTAPEDFDALFAPLDADPQGALNGVRDMANQPLEDEPRRVRDDLDAVLAHRSASSH